MHEHNFKVGDRLRLTAQAKKDFPSVADMTCIVTKIERDRIYGDWSDSTHGFEWAERLERDKMACVRGNELYFED